MPRIKFLRSARHFGMHTIPTTGKISFDNTAPSRLAGQCRFELRVSNVPANLAPAMAGGVACLLFSPTFCFGIGFGGETLFVDQGFDIRIAQCISQAAAQLLVHFDSAF